MSKFCKICLDSGKSETIYKSHFIRETKDPNSRIVCPTLLSLECRYCFKKGHTVKYCSVLLNKKKATPTPTPTVRVTPKTKPTSSNVYMVLMDDDEEEEERKDGYDLEYPALVQEKTVSKQNKSQIQSYATILQTVAVAVAVEEEEVEVEVEQQQRIDYAERKVNTKPLRWADCDSDSDSDSDW
jgi:hypothetical protein